MAERQYLSKIHSYEQFLVENFMPDHTVYIQRFDSSYSVLELYLARMRRGISMILEFNKRKAVEKNVWPDGP